MLCKMPPFGFLCMFMLKFMLMFMLMFMYACGMIFIHIQPISWYAFTRFREYLLSESTVE